MKCKVKNISENMIKRIVYILKLKIINNRMLFS